MALNEESGKNLREAILRTAVERKPETVSQLVQLVKQAQPISTDEILNVIIELNNEGKLALSIPTTLKISAYLKTSASLWYWATIILALATMTTVVIIPEADVPLVYVRYILGLVFVLWLPGYAFVRALFPQQLPVKTGDKDMDVIERTALSIGMSLVLVSMAGLLLTYTPWGMTLTSTVLSLLSMTMVFATAAVMREHHIRTAEKTVNEPTHRGCEESKEEPSDSSSSLPL